MSITALRNKGSSNTLRGKGSFANLRQQGSSSSLRESSTPVSEKISELLADIMLGVFVYPWMFHFEKDSDNTQSNRDRWETRVHDLRQHGRKLYFWFRELKIQIGPTETSKPLVNLLSGIIEESKGLCSLYISSAKLYQEPAELFARLDDPENNFALFNRPEGNRIPFDFESTRKLIYQLIGQFKVPKPKEGSSLPPPVPHKWTAEMAEEYMEKYWTDLTLPWEAEGDYENLRMQLARTKFERDEMVRDGIWMSPLAGLNCYHWETTSDADGIISYLSWMSTAQLNADDMIV
ncbi:hypothetical protein B0T20DRAFT_396061 [Sordaria brevicollis]|uniref:Uncharacterized protein n=1 Tax=Sordaria brevicollis TaxID=83679 RepID=A0AAE0U642_SORBR|nr:hypothetical protein B0T20DRAFT_396061 [Sordaria brevicollis]